MGWRRVLLAGSDLHERLCKNVFASDRLFADDTPIPVLDLGRGRTKTGRLWVYAHDQRPWGGPAPPAAVYLFAPDRKAERPVAHLAHFKGVLHVDGYAGFERLTGNGDIILAACWAHTKRKFYEGAEVTGSPVAAEAFAGSVTSMPSKRACAVSRPLIGSPSGVPPPGRSYKRCIAYLERFPAKWMPVRVKKTRQNKEVEPPFRFNRNGKGSSWKHGSPASLAAARLPRAIRYALSRWQGLMRFLLNGRIELETNPVERAIRPVALGRKNHLFAGSDGSGKSLGNRNLQTERRRTLRLPHRRAHRHGRWPSCQPTR
jgi:transposase